MIQEKKLEVYKVSNNKNGKIYIGITSQGIDVRWSKHCSDANTDSNFPIHNAIRKYGKENFQIEIIEVINNSTDYDQLKEREIYWIKEFDSYNREKGYNLTLGGDGTFGRFHSEETKDKIRQKTIGHKVSKDTKNRMSESQKNVKRNYSALAKLSNKRWENPEEREKASINNHRNVIILQYNKIGEFILEFRSLSEAARSLGKDNAHANISKCAKGKLKTAYGFIWKYKEEIE